MKSLIRTTLVAALFLCARTPVIAQLSDLHYLPPLKQKEQGFAQQSIYLTTPETTAFTVNVYQGTSTSPIATYSLSNSAPATYNPGDGDNNITLLTADKVGYVQSNSGLRFEAPSGKKFYVNWRGRSASQGSSLTSKGRAALGTAFKWVGAPNRGQYIQGLTNALGIMATEDGTTVTIFGYNPNCTFRQGTSEEAITADEITITLNKGQTYVAEASVTTLTHPNRDGWLGASVTSNKPIAVNFGQMHYQPKALVSSRDVAIDQIIPENTLGKEYIFVRGNGIDSLEFPVIIATQNNTQIYVNGGTSPIATINSGDYYQVPSTYYSQSSATGSATGANMYIRTSKEAYAVQSLAGAVSDATGDLNFIAPVNCLLANRVDYIPDVSNIAGQAISGGITILASTAVNDADITVTYGGTTVPTATLTAARKSVAGTSEWKTYFLPGLTGNVSVSATGPIAVGYFGYQNVIGASGYFSGFETIPTIEVQRIGDGCLPSTILKATPGFTAYTWYRDGVLVPGINANTYTPDKAGKFTVTVTNGSCAYQSANQYIYDCNPEIIVSTTADKNGIVSNETVNFYVTVRYLSDVNVTNLVLTNLVPSNVTITGTSATYGSVSNSGSTYTWNIGTMRNGEEHILTITAKGKTVVTPTPGTLTVSKTQTILGTESNKVADDFEETVTVYSGLETEPSAHPTGLYFTNTGSANPYNNVLHFTASATADGYLIVRKRSTAPNFVPVDGTAYSVGTQSGNEIIYVGSSTDVTDLSADALTDYHYAIYPYKGGGAASNYKTDNPLTAVINNRVFNDFNMPAVSKSSSAGLASEGVNVTFINGVVSGGTTITASRHFRERPTNYQNGLPSEVKSVRWMYYTVTSSAANPGEYVIVLDYSDLDMTEYQWSQAIILKRPNSSSAWQNVTDKLITYSADGQLGKIILRDLSSFSDFAVGSPDILLPLTWVEFNASQDGTSVKLDWKTVNEQNTQDFLVQHSNSGLDWYDIGTLAAAGNSTEQRSYNFVHDSPVAGMNYYRLMQRDLDGRYSYSPIRKVSFVGNVSRMTILGNPVMNGLLRVSVSERMKVSINGLDGRTYLTRDLSAGRHQIEVGQLPPGTYIIHSGQEALRFVIKK